MSGLMKVLGWTLVATLMLLIAAPSSVNAQERMTVEQWTAKMQQLRSQESGLKKDMADCDKALAALKGDLSNLDRQLASARGKLPGGLDQYRRDLEAARDQLQGLLRLSDDQLYDRKGEAERAVQRAERLLDDKRSKMARFKDLAGQVQRLVNQLKNRMKNLQPSTDTYTVVKGDYLWKISGKSDIYDNPMQWMRIYSFNRDDIKDPNLIFPKQVFKIHRRTVKGEYLVAKGDFLIKIAGMSSVYGDPKKWRSIYDANNTIISDPNLIYPYTVLRTP
jgi:hypothetical protein